MADYYAVLKRTLSGFGEPSESLRTKIYEKARVTIARQLDATQPPLPDETKAAQLAQLDAAIVQMEAEYAGPPADEFVGDPPPLPLGADVGADPVASVEPDPVAVTEPEPVSGEASDPVPETVPEPDAASDPVPEHAPDVVVEPEARTTTEPEPVVEADPIVVAEPATPETVASEMSSVMDPAPEPSGEVASEPADEEADPLADAFAAIEAARAAGPPQSGESEATEGAVAFEDGAFEAAAEREGATSVVSSPRVATSEPVAPTTSDVFDDRRVAERDAATLAAAPVAVPRSKSSGRGVLWFLLLIAAAGLLFLFRGPLLTAVGGSAASVDRFIAGVPVVGPYLVGEVDDPNDPTRPKRVPTIRITPQPEPAEPEVEEGKREQRLGTDGQEVDPAAGREDVGTLPPPSIPAPTVAEAPAPDEGTVRTVPITPAEPEPATEPAAEGVTNDPVASASDEPAATLTPAPVAIAQTAILYEEGSGTRETRSDRGAVVWSVVQESPGNGEAAEPAIRAELDVPERELKATITIRRNTDKALAASHLMEVNFQPAAGFSGQNVDEVLSVRMKADEQGQGAPLSVIPAKIAPGYFYIALDNLPSARERNVELLRSAKYIDIPVEYVTGRRALVSLEKGVVGSRVFGEALSAWDAKAE